jgi:MarR family transcriptional regulator, organic hydroperoxide resistance regulator
MKRRRVSSARMERYVPVIREFATRDHLLHDAAARRLGVHPTDEKVLHLLAGRALTAGDLVGYTGLTGAAVTALIDRLETQGFVTRERDQDDRRKVTVRAVSAKARELDRLYDGVGGAMEALLVTYDSAEFAAIIDFLVNATAVFAEQTGKIAKQNGALKAKG